MFLPSNVIQEDILFSWGGAVEQFLSQDLRLRVQTETWEVPFEHQETLFQCESGHALAQSAQGGGAEAILRSNLFGVLGTWL